MEKYIDCELDEIADCFYAFAHGFLDLDKIEYPKKHLQDIVLNEQNCNDGIFKKYYDLIDKLEDKLQEIEQHARKDEKDFDPNETMAYKL